MNPSAHLVVTAEGQRIIVVPPGAAPYIPPQPAYVAPRPAYVAPRPTPQLDVKTAPQLDVKAAPAVTITVVSPAAGLDVKTAVVDAKAAAFDPYYDYVCPHCHMPGIVNRAELNCMIFRHAEFKQLWPQVNAKTGKLLNDEALKNVNAHNALVDRARAGQPVSAHMPKAECDTLVAAGSVEGCCKPFRFDGVKAVICDYI